MHADSKLLRLSPICLGVNTNNLWFTLCHAVSWKKYADVPLLITISLQVQGKRFVYKFVCDLESLLGYSAAELNLLVLQASQVLQSANTTDAVVVTT